MEPFEDMKSLNWRHISIMKSLAYVNSTVCTTGQASSRENIKAPHYWTLVIGIYQWPLDSSNKGQAMWETFLCHDVIMLSSDIAFKPFEKENMVVKMDYIKTYCFSLIISSFVHYIAHSVTAKFAYQAFIIHLEYHGEIIIKLMKCIHTIEPFYL